MLKLITKTQNQFEYKIIWSFSVTSIAFENTLYTQS
jgi:hypothetical protein